MVKVTRNLLCLSFIGLKVCLADLSPHVQYAYAYNQSENTITPYGINPSTNALYLLDLPPIKTGIKPGGFGVHPSGKFIYLVNWLSSDISMYKPDLNTGNLISLGKNVDSGGAFPWAPYPDPTGKFAYVTNSGSNNIAMFAVDQNSGVLTPLHTKLNPSGIINSVGYYPTSLVFNDSGKFAYVANMLANNLTIFSVDQITGDLIPRTTKNINGIGPRKIITKNGYLYTVNQISNNISMFKIDESSGALNLLQPCIVSTGTSPIFMAIEPNGKYAYVTNGGDNTISMYRIGLDGTLSPLTPATVNTGSLPRNIYVNNLKYIYNANQNDNTITTYQVNEATGQLESLSPATISTGTTPEGIAFIIHD